VDNTGRVFSGLQTDCEPNVKKASAKQQKRAKKREMAEKKKRTPFCQKVPFLRRKRRFSAEINGVADGARTRNTWNHNPDYLPKFH